MPTRAALPSLRHGATSRMRRWTASCSQRSRGGRCKDLADSCRFDLAYPMMLRRTPPRRSLFTQGPETLSALGHLEPPGPNEAFVYFDNVYPMTRSFLDPRFWWSKIDPGAPARLMRNALPPGSRLHADNAIPQPREGGLVLKISWPAESTYTREAAANEIEAHLRGARLRPYFNPFRNLRAFLVRGRPWLEDLHRYPASRLKIEFDGPDLSQERLYELFRPFGKIRDIVAISGQKAWHIHYTSVRNATAARTCMHGYMDGPSRLLLTFARQMRRQTILDWLFSHPRIVIPILAAVLAGISVSIFEPIRTWSVQQTVSGSFHYTDAKWYKWLTSSARNLLKHMPKVDETRGTWYERESTQTQVTTWLDDVESTPIVVQGARGTGKRDLIRETLSGRRNVFFLDCEPLVDTRGESATIANLASQLGYRPIFSWANSISSLVDLAAQGLMGTSTGFSETYEAQIKTILGTGASALKRLALRGKRDPKLRDEDYLVANPQLRPVVVIDNFLYKFKGANVVYESIVRWAALLVQSNTAHVIFITSDLVTWPKMLGKELPNKLFHTIALSDPEPHVAFEYVAKKVSDAGRPLDEGDVYNQVKVLGGRLTDLDLLARRLIAGEAASTVTDEIVAQSAQEVAKLYFAPSENDGWTRIQAWTVMKTMVLAKANSEDVRYAQLLLDPTLKNGEVVLKRLEEAEMITIVTRNGRPVTVRPGRPVFDATFARLRHDRVFAAVLELERHGALASSEAATIAKCEEELCTLKTLASNSKVATRIAYLLNKLEASQAKITQLEELMAIEKAVLQTEN